MAEKKVIKKTSTVKATKPAPKAEKKVVAKPVEKVAVKKAEKKVVAKTTRSSSSVQAVESFLKITIVDTAGKAAGTMTLPKAIFGAEVNKQLIAQAVRVYLANQRQGNANTKTRGEVTGSTRKIYRQKGTGRARHGGIRAPIFVKGGIAHGPRVKDYGLQLPTKMKRAALFSALSAQLKSGNIIVVSGLEKVAPKTKAVAKAMAAVTREKTLLVMPGLVESVYKGARNIATVRLTSAQQLSTYDVIGAKKLVFMKEAIETLEKTFSK